ncbi:MAG: hypothetical protein A2920_02610 [Candidatus Zambryskibacteria bacterium RIFCSPLOWO2_01_FULL_43_17]|uniref:Uncharacterized protein n=1 Tax=Candidatus Zambryskibacteria bacterium RIFCSPLOWO2_01_FULL_43_17 TaxID=1802760 RepID=A0A1G2U170_9BACT|nr:MAG: hypothetical protein A2920_02610 [Candidatus Zambryskibacteria bacterium RIFCSPLOWO2_01_FULL_43_17]
MTNREMDLKVYTAMQSLIAAIVGAVKNGVSRSDFSPRTLECFDEAERRADAVYDASEFRTKFELHRSALDLARETEKQIVEIELPAIERRQKAVAVRIAQVMTPPPALPAKRDRKADKRQQDRDRRDAMKGKSGGGKKSSRQKQAQASM